MDNSDTIQNGKGDSPRNISRKFWENYDDIDWGHDKKKEEPKIVKTGYFPRPKWLEGANSPSSGSFYNESV